MSSEHPDCWVAGQIDDLVCEVAERVEPQQIVDPDTIYVGLEDIGQGTGTVVSHGRAGDATSQKSVFGSGDILFGKLRPNLRKVARPSFSGICSTDIVVFRAKSGVDPDFAFRVLQSEPVIKHAVAHAAGTKMPRAHARSILAFETSVPPLDEQRRIADVLRAVDDAVHRGERVVAQEAIVRNEVVAASFRGSEGEATVQSAIGAIPTRWTVEPLEDVCRSVGVGIASSATHAYRDDGVPLIRNQNIKPGYLDLGDLLYVTAEYDEEYASKRVREGDVITMRTGYPGRSAVVPKKLDGCQTFTTLISKPRTERILSEFLCEWINSPLGMREVRKLQAGGAQQNLNAGVLKRLPVPVPPLEDQARIVATLSSFRRSSVALEAARELRKSLAVDLISGRVRVPT